MGISQNHDLLQVVAFLLKPPDGVMNLLKRSADCHLIDFNHSSRRPTDFWPGYSKTAFPG